MRPGSAPDYPVMEAVSLLSSDSANSPDQRIWCR